MRRAVAVIGAVVVAIAFWVAWNQIRMNEALTSFRKALEDFSDAAPPPPPTIPPIGVRLNGSGNPLVTFAISGLSANHQILPELDGAKSQARLSFFMANGSLITEEIVEVAPYLNQEYPEIYFHTKPGINAVTARVAIECWAAARKNSSSRWRTNRMTVTGVFDVPLAGMDIFALAWQDGKLKVTADLFRTATTTKLLPVGNGNDNDEFGVVAWVVDGSGLTLNPTPGGVKLETVTIVSPWALGAQTVRAELITNMTAATLGSDLSKVKVVVNAVAYNADGRRHSFFAQRVGP